VEDSEVMNIVRYLFAKVFFSAKHYVNHYEDNRISEAIKKGYIDNPRRLSLLVQLWEAKNGDIRLNQALTIAFRYFAELNPNSIPDQAHVQEIVGRFPRAAELYVAKNELAEAARCYEVGRLYQQAEDLYLMLGNNEGVSRCAEALDDLEKALQYVLIPERKIMLLQSLKRYREAWDIAESDNDLHSYKTLIRAETAKHMLILQAQQDYIAAIELSEIAGQTTAEKENLLTKARKHYLKLIAESQSLDTIREIHKLRMKFEERAGNYANAGRIAEEDLGDATLSILLYEKANLFDRAIEITLDLEGDNPDSEATKLTLAGLQERGGNLIKAARLYESAGNHTKACELYRELGQFGKALECYQKVITQDKDVLIGLYTSTGDFRTAINTCLETGEITYYEKALDIVNKYNKPELEASVRGKINDYMAEKSGFLVQEYKKAWEEISNTYSPIIGIDFGTTNSAAAIFNKFSQQVEIITDHCGREYEPSFYGLDDHNHPIFGEYAKAKFHLSPESVVARVKRIIGEKKIVKVAGKNYRTEEVVGRIIHRIKTNASRYLASKAEEVFTKSVCNTLPQIPHDAIREFLDKHKPPFVVNDVVISVPAYFNNSQKRAIRDAAEIAGLRVRRLLHEPTAAAMAYGHQKNFEGVVAIIDLGGGTLDISILDISKGLYEVKTIFGDTKLGGSDVDAILVEEIVKDVLAKTGIKIDSKTNPVEMAWIEEASEQLKIALSEATKYSIIIPNFLNQRDYTFTLSINDLERLAEPFFRRLEKRMEQVLDNKGVNHYLLVGNASKMPAVQKLAAKLYRFRHLTGIDPGTVVVYGDALEAAVLSGSLKETLLLDVVPYSMGISVLKKDSNHMEEFSKIIAKDCTIPTTNTEHFTTTEDNQTEVRIKIYQGESMIPSNNHFLGDFILTGIKPAPAGTPKIEVTFDINADCILMVTARDLGTGNVQAIRIEDTITLSPAEMQHLKGSFTQNEKQLSLESDIGLIQKEIEGLAVAFDNSYLEIGNTVVKFRELFANRVESTPSLYTASEAQFREIQLMFLQKEQLVLSMPAYKDKFATLLRSYREFDRTGLDMSAADICARLSERKESYLVIRRLLSESIKSFDRDISGTLAAWMDTLKSMAPDVSRMNPIDTAKHFISLGQFGKALEMLEKPEICNELMGREVFQLLEKCYVERSLGDKYKALHNQYGKAIDYRYPDINKLNAYLKIIDESIVMIRVNSQQNVVSGSGFCFAPDSIATNKHVVQGTNAENITVIGKHGAYSVERITSDPLNDIAVLSVKCGLPSLRLGEFNFVEPGEEVIAIGFPYPSSDDFSENLFISKGIVNAIKKSNWLRGRVLYIDSRIGSGMSGGPLINDLGEVVGVLTLIEYLPEGEDERYFQAQPVAQPIHLVKRLAL
jgi:molecular chaperone DnaK